MNSRIFIAAMTIACAATPAFAHAFLQHADPGAGATLRAPPKRVTLTFSEKLEPVFSGVAVTDSSGRNVEGGAVVIRGNSMAVPLRSLPPGTYRVVWRVVSVDTHRTEGAYSFSVKP
jgi:methionine-rich copper-binding protein CopC